MEMGAQRMRRATIIAIVTILVIAMPSCSPQKKQSEAPAGLETKISRFVPVTLTGEVAKLSGGDRQALQKLIAAAKYMDSIYVRQVWSGNETLLKRLESDTSPIGAQRLRLFQLERSPWSSLDHQEPFVDGVPNPRPPQANYYPDDMSKEEFTQWVEGLPEADRALAEGYFTTIRRTPERKLVPVPYSTEYADLLHPAAQLLREAASLTTNVSLRAFLNKRADAFLSNDYYESDVAWMDLDSPIEPTIGPYEVYMDGLFNYKAAFEAYITIRNDEETARLAQYSAVLQEIENNLPIDPAYRNPKLGAAAPIRVVDEVAIGGEARAGVQTAAFNLPNDERVVTEKGSKRVMLKNVQEAKFKAILTPIADRVVDQAQRSSVAFEPFFTHILVHELMHGLGPHAITVNGKAATVRGSMKELGSALEEAKADISGLFALQYLIDHGYVAKTTEQSMYVTYLAGVFRSIRFGIKEAHGRGMALQFNYLSEKGAFTYNESSRKFSVNIDAIKEGVRSLTGEIMTIQAQGSYERAKALLGMYAVIRPQMQHALEGLADIPVDIAPHHPLAD
jgi:hypothetical protein